MKRSRFFFLVCTFIFIPSIALAQSAASFPQSPAWKKLDAPTQQAWTAAFRKGDMSAALQCFVRANEPLRPGDQDFLTSSGFVIRLVANTVASGSVTVANLPSVANLPFVVSIRTAEKKQQ